MLLNKNSTKKCVVKIVKFQNFFSYRFNSVVKIYEKFLRKRQAFRLKETDLNSDFLILMVTLGQMIIWVQK